MKDLQLLERMLELLNQTGAGAIEIRKNLWSTTIRVSKDAAFGHSGPVTYQVAAPGGSPNPDGAAAETLPPRSGEAGKEKGEGAAAVETHLHEIKSPMVGTFYAQPEPGAEPYVQVGSRLSPGLTLCIIEAMKIMNPIDAEVSGVIKEIVVQDAQPVEYGQVLFRVDTNA